MADTDPDTTASTPSDQPDRADAPTESLPSAAPSAAPSSAADTSAPESAAPAAGTPDMSTPADVAAPGAAAPDAAAPGKGVDPKKRPRRRRNKKTRADSGGRSEGGAHRGPTDLLEDGLAALASAYRDLRSRTGGGRLDEADEVEVTLRLPLKRSEAPRVAESLFHEWRDALEKRVLAAGLLVPGRAWCFRSESFDDASSRPDDPRQVLVGYGLEGRPRYADLVTLAIERKHESVDELLAGKEGAVSFVESGASITDGVKPAFEPDAAPHRLVGQAMCGLFASSEEGRRVALTVQVLAHDAEDGRLRLNAHPVSAVDLLDLPDSSIRKILRNYQSTLVQIARQLDGRKAAGETVDVTEAVLPSLREVAHRLSADARNRDRKTEHARERGSEGQRPTQLAFPEARSARDHHLYIDTKEQTVVVVGKKGRVHMFSPDGRHVTTVVIPPKTLRERVSQGRWRQAEPAERGSFREALANNQS